MATRKAMGLGLNMLIVGYPNYSPAIDDTLNLWADILGDLPDDTLQAAILSLTSKSRAFAPSVGEIREEAFSLLQEAAGIPSAYQAYREVVNMPKSMQRQVGFEDWPDGRGSTIVYEGLKFSHPMIEKVARLMGWPDDFPTDNPGVDRGQFIKAYDAELAKTFSINSRLPALADFIGQKAAAMLGDAGAKNKALADMGAITRKMGK